MFKSCLLPSWQPPKKLTVAELCLKALPPLPRCESAASFTTTPFCAALWFQRTFARRNMKYRVFKCHSGTQRTPTYGSGALQGPCCCWMAATRCQHPLKEPCVKRYICPECVGRWCHRGPLPFLSPLSSTLEASRCIFYERNAGTSGQC